MKIIQVNLAEPLTIDFEPANTAAEVGQNIYTLLSTAKYTVPLDRNFGLSTTFIDQPINAVKAKIRAEIMEAIARYEPRFTVTSIEFSSSELTEGALYPVVRGGIDGT